MKSGVSFLHPQALGAPGGMFSPGVLISQPSTLLFIAGQIAATADGSVVGEDDFPAQVRQVFANIGSVLEEAGMEFRDVVKLGTFIVGADHLPEFVATRAEIFPGLFGSGPYPVNTLVVVDRLARPQCRIEIEAVAVRGE